MLSAGGVASPPCGIAVAPPVGDDDEEEFSEGGAAAAAAVACWMTPPRVAAPRGAAGPGTGMGAGADAASACASRSRVEGKEMDARTGAAGEAAETPGARDAATREATTRSSSCWRAAMGVARVKGPHS